MTKTKGEPGVTGRGPAIVQATWLSSSHYLGQLLFLVRGLFLARLLGQFDFGVWTSMRVVRDLGRFLSLGVPEGMEQLAPYAQASGDRDHANRLRSVAAGIVIIAAVFAGGWIAVSGLNSGPTSPESRELEWFVFAGVFVLAQLYLFSFAVMRTVHGFRSISLITVTVTTSSMFGLFAIPRFGLLGFLMVLGAAYGLGVLIAASLPPRVRPGFQPAAAKKLLTSGFPIMGANLLASLQWNLDKIFIWAYLGNSALGVYALSTHLVNAVMIFPRSVAAVMYPRLREQLGNTGSLNLEIPQLRDLTRFFGHLAIPTLGLLWIGLEYLVLIAFPGYLDAVAPARVLLLGVYLPVVAGLASPILISNGRHRLLIGVRILGLGVTTLGLLWVQNTDSGILFVALATASGLFAESVASILAIFKVLRVSQRDALRFLARTGGGLAGLSAVLFIAVGIHPARALAEITVGRMVGSSLIVAALSIWLVLTLVVAANGRSRSSPTDYR